MSAAFKDVFGAAPTWVDQPPLRTVEVYSPRNREVVKLTDASDTPLGRIVARYLRERVDRGEITLGTARGVGRALRRFAVSYGRRPVAQLSRQHINRWLESMPDLSAGTRRKYLSDLTVFVKWMQVEGVIKTNPLAGVKPIRIPRRVPRAIGGEEVDALWAVLPDARARAIVALMLGLGLRRIEVVRAEVADWDRRQRTLRVIGKGGHERIVPVPDEIGRVLSAYIAEDARWGPLIRNERNGKALTPEHLSRLMQQWMEAAGVKHAPGDGRSCHALRHTLASQVADVEPDLRVVQQILGHQSLSSTQVYLRYVNLSRMRDALEAAGVADAPVFS